MFEGITRGLTDAIKGLRGKRFTEANIRDGLQQVRTALLDADVNYNVATAFIDRVAQTDLQVDLQTGEVEED